MFDISRNIVAIKSGDASIINRTKLLILTEPTELYNNPTFGVGLKRYLWQYNNENTKALIKDKIVAQLDAHEPCVESSKTAFADGLLYSNPGGAQTVSESMNQLTMTVGLRTIYDDDLVVTVDLEEERKKMFGLESE